MSAQAVTAEPAAAGAPAPKARTFYWSVLRELWENPSIYLAPAVVAAVALVAVMIGSFHLPGLVRAASAVGASPKHAANLMMAYNFSAGVVVIAALIGGVFYGAGALHNERRDRSILFWKSLPVSDRTTVLSKVFAALVVLPVAVLPVVIAMHLAMLALQTAILAASGVDPALLWVHLNLIRDWVTLAYGLVVLSLWYVPVAGWLLMISGWAKRVPMLWAIGAPLAVCLFELLAFRTHYAWNLLMYRLKGGFDQAFTVGGLGQTQITGIDELEPVRFLTDVGLWSGLAFGVACIAVCIWQRRYRDPI